MKTLYLREKYLNEIKPYIGTELIKVLTGQRRVGKTIILIQLMNMIKEQDKDANCIYINKEYNDFREIRDSNDLFNYVSSRLSDKKSNYIFIDEVQEIDGFETGLRQLFAKGIDIYCTGSNAKMLSGDLATHLSGRYIEFHISSLSYPEFLESHNLSNNNDALNLYIRYGGMPYLISLPMDDDMVYGYLKSVYNTVILKDVVARYSIRDVDFLDRLVEHLSDNLGSYVSSKKISDFLKAQRVNLSVNTVSNYLKYLTNAYFINKVNRYDIIGKRRFEINDKYFFSDLGLIQSITPLGNAHMGNIMENLVYNHLIYRNYKVSIGKYQDREIDFVAQKGKLVKYIQVAYLIADEKVKTREFKNLLGIKDNYEKLVVSADDFTSGDKGIKHINIKEFLLG